MFFSRTEAVILFLTDGEPTDNIASIKTYIERQYIENRFTLLTFGLGANVVSHGSSKLKEMAAITDGK